jgi:uncharacterized protein (DUF1015 family)
MATLVPFRALRPTPDAAPRVAAVPYDVVSTDEARSLAADNPHSFLHVSRPEIDLPPDTDPHADAVYAKAVENFCALKKAAPLVVDDAPSFYVYRLRVGAHVQDGVAGCYSLAEYEAGVIKKHEHTRPDKEDDRTRHMIALRAQTGPVFLVYRALRTIDDLMRDTIAGGAPLFDFVAPDGVQHAIWRIGSRDQAAYIADGHHRAASAARARRKLAAPGGEAGAWDTFLAVAFPDTQVQVLPYNRVVRDLGPHTPSTLLAALRKRFTVRDGPSEPARKGEVAMFLDGRWHTIELGAAVADRSAADRLDVSRLQEQLLTPLLGIGDVRTDKRIDFIGGARGTAELEGLVRLGRAAVAFSMYPVSAADLMAVCDAGGIMPPKSTWFEPKLRDGLLSHQI